MSELTDLDVCNRALTKLGVSPIETLDDNSIGTDIEAVCARVYRGVRDTVLCLYPWPFAKQKRALARLSDETPLNEWTSIYSLPDSMAHGPMAVYGDGSDTPCYSYEIIDGKLYTDYETVLIDFIARPPVSEWHPVVIQFFVTVLAMELSIPLTESSDRADALRIQAYGPAQLDGNGGLFVFAKRAVSQTKPQTSLFQNGDPLTGTRF